MEKDKFNRTITELDLTLMSSDMRGIPLGLFNGQMGICIYFFHLARLRNKPEYRTFAEKLLNQLFSSAHDVSAIHFPAGMSGIAWGIHHLLENRFVTGSFDYVLQEADDLLYRTIHFEWLDDEKKSRTDFIWLLVYYADRLRTIKNKEEKTLAQKTVIRILNHIEDFYSDTPWDHPAIFNLETYELPLYLLILGKLYKSDFYNYKIVQILEGLSNTVLSSLPALHANRFFLLAGIRSILQCIHMPQWEIHAGLLADNIDYDTIVNQEFLNKNITLRRGVAGFCFLLSKLVEGEEISSGLKEDILRKIESSEIWEGRFNPASSAIGGNVGLLNGYTGVILMYTMLLNS